MLRRLRAVLGLPNIKQEASEGEGIKSSSKAFFIGHGLARLLRDSNERNEALRAECSLEAYQITVKSFQRKC